MIYQRIVFPSEISAKTREETSHSDATKMGRKNANVPQVKGCVEAWIKQYPGVSLGAAFCLGLCAGWLIKRK